MKEGPVKHGIGTGIGEGYKIMLALQKSPSSEWGWHKK